MKTYVIEREIPGIGKAGNQKLRTISQVSCKALTDLSPHIEWVQSYVTGHKIYCIYKAKNEELIREHARRGGFIASAINEVAVVISPATAQ